MLPCEITDAILQRICSDDVDSDWEARAIGRNSKGYASQGTKTVALINKHYNGIMKRVIILSGRNDSARVAFIVHNIRTACLEPMHNPPSRSFCNVYTVAYTSVFFWGGKGNSRAMFNALVEIRNSIFVGMTVAQRARATCMLCHVFSYMDRFFRLPAGLRGIHELLSRA